MKRIVTLFLVFVMVFTCFPVSAFAAEPRASVGMANVGPEGYQVMTSSQELVDVTKAMEGFSETPYWDYGQYTIGFGCNASQEEGFIEKINVKDAEELLRRELKESYEKTVNSFCAKIGKQPNQHQFDALVSFTYNCGGGWTSNSRLATWLRNPTTERDFVSAMGAWKRAGGSILTALVQRRILEAVMFLKGEYYLSQNLSAAKKEEWMITSNVQYISPMKLPYYASAVYKLDGGKVSEAYSDGDKYNDFVMYYAKGSAYSPIPLPVKEGFTFAGWKITRIGYDDTIGGIVTIDTVVKDNVELTAQWVPAGTQVPNQDKLHGVNNTQKPEEGDKPNTGDNDKPTVQIPAAGQPFTDVYTDSWYRDNVVFVYEKGYMNGMETNRFGPDEKLTRGMMVTVLYRMAGSPAVKNKDHGFRDVNPDMYYVDAIAWAKENGIVNGMGDGEFAPDIPLSRQQAVTIFYRYCVEYKHADGSKMAKLDAFPDGQEVASWAETGMKWAVANNVITGNGQSDGTVLLDVNGNLTRCQCATLIYRCCNQILK